MDKYIVFARPKSKNIIFPLKKGDTSIIQFLQKKILSYNQEEEIIMIRTPFYREAISPDNTFETYPNLILTTKPNIYQRPDYYILICPKNDEPLIFFYLSAIVQNDIQFPKWEVGLNPSEFSNQTSENLCDFLIQKFPYEIDKKELPFIVDEDEQPIPTTIPSEEMINSMKNKKISIKCFLSETVLKTVKHRSLAINEIQSTEITYLSDLLTIKEVVIPQFKKFKIFTNDDDYRNFNVIENMIQFHSQFLKNLKMIGNSFDSSLSLIFLELSDFFKIVKIYIKNLGAIYELMNKVDKVKIEQIMQNEPSLNKYPMSYFITPFQRVQKYPLLLRQLIDFTPKCHPDSDFLDMALDSMLVVMKNIDCSKEAVENQEKVIQLFERISKKVDILDSSRVLLCEFSVIIKNDIEYDAVLYLFNDMVLVTVKENWKKKEEKPVFHKKIEFFNYFDQEIQFKTITICDGFEDFDGYTVIQFDDCDNKKKFIELVEKNRSEIFNEKNQKNTSFFIEKVTLNDFPFHSYGQDSAAIGSVMFTFGGHFFNDEYSKVNSFFNTVTKSFTFSTSQNGPSERADHAMASDDSNSCVYLFGGRKDNEYLNDLFVGTLKSENEIEWEMIVTENSEEAPQPRSNHTMVFHDDELFVFGGKNDDQVFNDVFIFSIKEKKWTQPFSNSKSQPSPRYDHSACTCGPWMVIHGGQNSEVYNDTFFFDMEQKKWLSFKITGESKFRHGHRSFYMNGYIVFIGGLDDRNRIAPPSAINATKDGAWQYEDFEMKGNIPPTLFLFSMAAINECHFFVYGGIDHSFSVDFMSNFFYRIDLPFCISKSGKKSLPVPQTDSSDESDDSNSLSRSGRRMSYTEKFFNLFRKSKTPDAKRKNNSFKKTRSVVNLQEESGGFTGSNENTNIADAYDDEIDFVVLNEEQQNEAKNGDENRNECEITQEKETENSVANENDIKNESENKNETENSDITENIVDTTEENESTNSGTIENANENKNENETENSGITENTVYENESTNSITIENANTNCIKNENENKNENEAANSSTNKSTTEHENAIENGNAKQGENPSEEDAAATHIDLNENASSNEDTLTNQITNETESKSENEIEVSKLNEPQEEFKCEQIETRDVKFEFTIDNENANQNEDSNQEFTKDDSNENAEAKESTTVLNSNSNADHDANSTSKETESQSHSKDGNIQTDKEPDSFTNEKENFHTNESPDTDVTAKSDSNADLNSNSNTVENSTTIETETPTQSTLENLENDKEPNSHTNIIKTSENTDTNPAAINKRNPTCYTSENVENDKEPNSHTNIIKTSENTATIEQEVPTHSTPEENNKKTDKELSSLTNGADNDTKIKVNSISPPPNKSIQNSQNSPQKGEIKSDTNPITTTHTITSQPPEFDFESVAREIQIDASRLLPFQQKKLDQNLRHYHSILTENRSILAKIYEFFSENVSDVKFTVCDIFVKIFDPTKNKTIILKIRSDTDFHQFVEILTEKVQHKVNEKMSKIMKIYPMTPEFYGFCIDNVLKNKVSHLSVVVL